MKRPIRLEPVEKPGPAAELDLVFGRSAASPSMGGGLPSGRRPFFHKAALLLSRRS